MFSAKDKADDERRQAKNLRPICRADQLSDQRRAKAIANDQRSEVEYRGDEGHHGAGHGSQRPVGRGPKEN